MATRIQDLPAASQITSSDFFVIQQGGEAKKLSGAEMTQYIAGHGGINSITLNDDYTLTFTMTDGEEITIGSVRGKAGEDGISPSVQTEEGVGGVSITITDRLGPHTAFLANGTDGDDGFSPQVTLTPTAGGTNLTIVDATGSHTAFIANGEGAGDMLSYVYDPQGKARDIFQYTDEQLDEVNAKLTLLEHMTLQNDFSVPIATDDEDLTLIVDDLDNAILADWKYKEV